MVGQLVWRSRCIGKSTTPSAVPEPGWSEVKAWTNISIASGIIPAPLKKPSPPEQRVIAFAHRVPIRRRPAAEIDRACLDREPGRLRPAARQIPAGNGHMAGNRCRDNIQTGG